VGHLQVRRLPCSFCRHLPHLPAQSHVLPGGGSTLWPAPHRSTHAPAALPLPPSRRANPTGSARSAARRFASALVDDREYDAEEAALSNVDAREAARRAADPLSALDIPSLGALWRCVWEGGGGGGCWVGVKGVDPPPPEVR
jgi:hypothetical protein